MLLSPAGSSERNAHPGRTTLSIQVDGPDQVGEARRAIISLATSLGFDEGQRARVALVATESATNLWRHGRGGEILLTSIARGEPGIELLALDKGPGMANVQACLQDGYSTAGSSGTGLGAISRLAGSFDVYSVPGKGTALLARCWGPTPGASSRLPETYLKIGGVSVPKRGETACGDSFAVFDGPDYTNVLVVDGLGHGPLAAESASAAVDAFLENGSGDPAQILADIHPPLRPTRGAAAAVARFDHTRHEIRFAGLGNIAGVIMDGERSRQTVSQPGILGHDNRYAREFSYPWPPTAMAVLYSDGIATHWSAGSYEGLWSRDPALIAGVLYRDHTRGRDDATVLAIQQKLAL